MRKVIESQMKFGEVDISKIEFDLRSRDEIPKLLMGLQYIYCTPELRDEVFQILEEIVPEGTDSDNGRPGMLLWKILVLGTLRLNCNWDYDKVKEIADNHKTLRQMLGHGCFEEDDYKYPIQTIKDNVSLLTPEVLDKINQVVVKAGHNLVKKKEEKLRGRCDSFVVETDVHYPTDINLLFDAMRKVITLIGRLCMKVGVSDWRQSSHNIRTIKKLYRKAQKIKHSTSKDERKREERDNLIIEAHRNYVDRAESFLEKAEGTLRLLLDMKLVEEVTTYDIDNYMRHAERQIDQIRRRVIGGERIPHEEKVFSIFEEHTEWISKGKAGVPQELGLEVCVLEDQYRFILHHEVMQKTTDEAVAVPIARKAKEKFADLISISFDKGFYSPGNRQALTNILDHVILPKKGRLNIEEKNIEYSEDFIQGKRKHAAVESGINALENHGLDRCPDHAIVGFKRYIALAILGRNLQNLGNIIRQKKFKIERRRESQKYRQAS